ncbi:trypsin-like peptidase domain-containing protein [Streptomyces sp. NPDC001922]|uniref:trypsin-like peptidase domain-containing protein n=1 Tax=Streptomyces sp. NPDC001922 TaxID=3364624 RepID=UPI00367E1F88
MTVRTAEVDAALIRVCDLAGRPRGTGFLADDRGTLLTSHETVDGLVRLVLHTPDGQVRLAEADAITALPETGLALVRTEGLPVPPLPVAARTAFSGARVRLRAREWTDARADTVTSGVTYTATDRFHRLGQALELTFDGAGAGGLRLGARATGGPVLDAATGTVVAVLGTALHAGHRAAAFAVPLRAAAAAAPDGPLAALLARNGATVPAYGRDLNLAAVLELTAASHPASPAGDGGRPPVERPEPAAEFAAFLGSPQARVLALVGGPGEGRSTELGALAERRARGAAPAPTVRLRGADLRPHDGSVADAVRRALLTAAGGGTPDAAGAGMAGAGPFGAVVPDAGALWGARGETVDPDRVAGVAREAGRPLLVVLDGPEEMPPLPEPRLRAWCEETAEWLRATGTRLVVACRPEYWEHLWALFPEHALHRPGPPDRAAQPVPAPPGPPGCVRLGDLPPDAARLARARYGIPEGVLAERDAAHPLTLRLYAEVREAWRGEEAAGGAASANGSSGTGPVTGEDDGAPGREAPAGTRLTRADVFAAHLDLMCLRIAARLAGVEDPPLRGAAVRRLAARVAGQVHDAARRCLGPGQGELDAAAFEEVFPSRTGWAAAVLGAGLLVPAGAGYRFAHEEFADWLQAHHLDLDPALHALVHRWCDAPGLGGDAAGAGEEPGRADGDGPCGGTEPEPRTRGRRRFGRRPRRTTSAEEHTRPRDLGEPGRPGEHGGAAAHGAYRDEGLRGDEGDEGLRGDEGLYGDECPHPGRGAYGDGPPQPRRGPYGEGGGAGEADGHRETGYAKLLGNGTFRKESVHGAEPRRPAVPLPVPRHRIGPVVQALLLLEQQSGPARLDARLRELAAALQALATVPGPWAQRTPASADAVSPEPVEGRGPGERPGAAQPTGPGTPGPGPGPGAAGSSTLGSRGLGPGSPGSGGRVGHQRPPWDAEAPGGPGPVPLPGTVPSGLLPGQQSGEARGPRPGRQGTVPPGPQAGDRGFGTSAAAEQWIPAQAPASEPVRRGRAAGAPGVTVGVPQAVGAAGRRPRSVPGADHAFWWACRLLAETVRRLPDARPYRALLHSLAEHIAHRSLLAGGFGGTGLDAFGPSFWASLALDTETRLGLLRPLLPADAPAGGPGPRQARFLDVVSAQLRDDPAGAQPVLCRWFDDDRPLRTAPGTGAGAPEAGTAPRPTVATAAQALLHTHRRRETDGLTDALVAAGHPRAEELLAALAEDEPSAVCRAVHRWARAGRAEWHAAAAAFGPAAARHTDRDADRALLRHAALALLIRPDAALHHGAALALLVGDPETRSRHLPQALARFVTGDPQLPPSALAPALATHPEPVLDAFRARLNEPGETAAEVLLALADPTGPALHRRAAALVRAYVAARPEGARHAAAFLARLTEHGPAAREVLLSLLTDLLAEQPPQVRSALVPALAAPGSRTAEPLRRELLDALLEHEGNTARDPDCAVLVALLAALADGAELRAEEATRELVRRTGLLMARTPEGAAAFDRRLVELTRQRAGFGRRVREWLVGAPGEWTAVVGPAARRLLKTAAEPTADADPADRMVPAVPGAPPSDADAGPRHPAWQS